jgi:hypothetical protein
MLKPGSDGAQLLSQRGHWFKASLGYIVRPCSKKKERKGKRKKKAGRGRKEGREKEGRKGKEREGGREGNEGRKGEGRKWRGRGREGKERKGKSQLQRLKPAILATVEVKIGRIAVEGQLKLALTKKFMRSHLSL